MLTINLITAKLLLTCSTADKEEDSAIYGLRNFVWLYMERDHEKTKLFLHEVSKTIRAYRLTHEIFTNVNNANYGS